MHSIENTPRVMRLGPDDVARLRRLNALFGDVFGDRETYGAAPPADAWVRTVLGNPGVIALVAELGDAMVGGLVAYELDKLERMRREIYVYDLAVDAAHRRKGIATALIARVREIAAVRGAWVVFVQADHGDAAAIGLYTRLGTREDVLHFDIDVPGPSVNGAGTSAGRPG